MLLAQKLKKRTDIYGKQGEDLACKYLKENGYKIIKRNYLCSIGEIDIIAQIDNRIVFVEVKARSAGYYGYGRDSINEDKLMHIKNASIFFLKSHSKYGNNIRYDLIEIFNDEITAHLIGIM